MKSIVLAAGAIACCMTVLAQVPPATGQMPTPPFQRSAEPKKLDLNGDGFISREEAKGDPGLDRGFGRIDSNKDGRLSQDELKVLFDRREARREERHNDKQRKYGEKSKDRDGQQDRDGEPGRRGARGFAGLDANKDGFLSRDEAESRPELQKRFNEIDRNGDNRLSREELRAARRKS